MQLLKQANEFEKLAEILKTVAKTEQNKAMAQVAEGMVRVCGMAEAAEKEED